MHQPLLGALAPKTGTSQFPQWGVLMRLRLASAGWLLVALVLGSAAIVWADKVTLRDGTVLEGTVIKEPDGYWFKGENGERRHIPDADVASVEKGTLGAGSGGPTVRGSLPRVGSLASTKRRADEVDTPVAAVSIWQQFIDSKPSEQDLKVAREELAKWKKLQQDGAEKIRGKWVGGDERKKIVEKARQLHKEGIQLMESHQTLQAVKKLEESQTVYPNSFPSAFWLGYLSMLQSEADNDKGMLQKAINYFNQALRIRPNSPEALADLGLCQLQKREYQDAVMSLYKAAQSGDNAEIAQDLVTALSALPPAQLKSDRIRPAVQAASLLASRYNVSGPGPLTLVGLKEKDSPGGGQKDVEAGGYYSGTGFLISPEGLILTNRHVVENSKTLLVMLGDNTEKSAEVVNIDDEQDLALIKVKPDGRLPFLRLSPNDSPAEGAECTVMGFPLIDRLGESIKVTRGIVSSRARQEIGADVMIDAKVNPGNSGGPILDKYGHVMAIVCLKTLATSLEDSYGFGISTGQIRKYLAKNHVELPKAAPTLGPLTTEQIVGKVKPAAVCILSTR